MQHSPEQHTLLMQALTGLRQRFPDAQVEPQGIPGSQPIFRCTINGERRWIPFLPGEVVICESLQEARRKVNVYDVQHLQALQPGFGATPREQDLPSVYVAPAKALFETHELVRLPVDVDEHARDFLNQANQQTRLFGQALSEAFGTLAGVERLSIEYQERPEFDVPTLFIQALASDPAQQHFWHIRTDDLARRSVNGEAAFQARYAAAELVRLYIEHINR